MRDQRQTPSLGQFGQLPHCWDRQSLFCLLAALLLVTPFLCVGLSWGLPSNAGDRFFFASHTPLTGSQILRLAGGWTDAQPQGADVARHESTPNLTASDADRARILLRYRLYTYQPDEMINLRAYSQMSPAKLRFDPRLYQYGGIWFYPNAIFLKAASSAHLCALTSDAAFYIDDPAAAGRIYLILRLIVVAYALVGVTGIYLIARRWSSNSTAALLTALAFATSPGVVVFGHEAKPHIAGLTFAIFALWAGGTFIETRRIARLYLCTFLAGCAFATVLTFLPAVLIPLAALWIPARRLNPGPTAQILAIFLATYFAANPYVLHHLLFNRPLLFHQLANTAAMYHLASLASVLTHPFALLFHLTPAICVVPPAVLAWAARLMPRQRSLFSRQSGVAPNPSDQSQSTTSNRVPLQLILPAALVVTALFAALSVNKPGEYARFGLLLIPAILFLILTFPPRLAKASLLLTVLFNLAFSVPALLDFHRDTLPQTSRLKAAEDLAALQADPSTESALYLAAEPAPYNMPPVDLWRTQLILSSKPTYLQPPNSDSFLNLSWANRTFFSPKDRPASPPTAASTPHPPTEGIDR